MDPIFKEDTQETHWKLNRNEGVNLLNFLFPDELLFLKSLGVLAENRDHYSMNNIIQHCRKVNVLGVSVDDYCDGDQESNSKLHHSVHSQGETPGKGNTGRRGRKGKDKEPPEAEALKEVWLGCPPLHPEALRNHEAPLADFMNKVLETIKQACNL